MPETELQEAGGPPARILIVEDNDGDIFLLTLALEKAAFPHSLTVFRDGADAMKFLRGALLAGGDALPGLAMLDLNLPRVDGSTVIEMFRTEPALSNIPVVLMSSSRAPQDSALAGKLNKCIFAVKPSDLSAYMNLGVLARDFWMRERKAAGQPNPASLRNLADSSGGVGLM